MAHDKSIHCEYSEPLVHRIADIKHKDCYMEILDYLEMFNIECKITSNKVDANITVLAQISVDDI